MCFSQGHTEYRPVRWYHLVILVVCIFRKLEVVKLPTDILKPLVSISGVLLAVIGDERNG